MAGEGSELSTRMSLEDQNIDNRLFETVFRHFKRHKVQISNAIKKTFPFFEGLHDNELITSKMYEDCQDSCRNLVPVSRVVYNVLSELEKTFNPSLLEAVFSEVNMQEYPDLNNIYKSFEKVIQEKINYEESNGQKRPTIQLSLEQGTGGHSSPTSSSQAVPLSHDGMTPRENGLSDHLSETEQMNAKMKDRTSDQNGALESQQANEQCAQESEPAGAKPSNHGLQINSCSVHLEDIKKEKPFFNSEVQLQARARTDQVSDIIVISSEDSAESSDGDEFPEPSTPTPRRAAGDLPDQGIEPECPPWQADTLPLSHLGSQNTPIKIEPRNFRKTTTSRKRVWQRVIRSEESLESSEDEAPWGTQSSALRSDPDKDPTDIRNTSIRRRSNRKRWMSGGDSSDLSNEGEPQATSSSALINGSDSTDIGSNSTLGKHSGKRRIETVCTEPLKRGRKRGPRVPRDTNMDFRRDQLPVTCGEAKGILYKEKMIKGSSEKCIKDKNGKWFTLKEFEDEGDHKASKNWKQSVRCGGWPLKILIQDSYQTHQEKGKRNPWSCIFCQIKDLKKCCPESQPIYQESEILQKRMLPREQLKCEFLLLKVYCSPKSSFFVSEPHYTRDASQDLEEPMWLNKIKDKLMMTLYYQVWEFVRDMRLIFQNHNMVYRDSKFIGLGLQLETQFENDFKDIFGIQEISTNST
ncbi:nuclear autoantigen Sp-100 isoform X8 [Bos indicus]|uniref:Nuclear autoantigen Sp-100 isoform X8 n=1 Tax=Bos indicus TaxID=9915 RepID=A0ABM4R2K7_BOSIN